MTVLDLEKTFEKYDDDFLEFERVANPLHRRPDLCAFILLDKLVPPTEGRNTDMVAAAEHNEIWLDTDCPKLAEAATEDDILTLIRCGIRFDWKNDSLAMFV